MRMNDMGEPGRGSKALGLAPPTDEELRGSLPQEVFSPPFPTLQSGHGEGGRAPFRLSTPFSLAKKDSLSKPTEQRCGTKYGF